MSIRIFVTGGTFDKEYNEINGQLFFKETHLPEMIARSRVSPQVTVTTLMMIDSLDMKPIDRELIANHCRAQELPLDAEHVPFRTEVAGRPVAPDLEARVQKAGRHIIQPDGPARRAAAVEPMKALRIE